MTKWAFEEKVSYFQRIKARIIERRIVTARRNSCVSLLWPVTSRRISHPISFVLCLQLKLLVRQRANGGG